MKTNSRQDPPLTELPPRGGGIGQRIWAVLGFLMFAGVFGALMVYTGPPLVSDWQVRDTAQPAARGHIVKGSCTTKLVVAICDLTLSNRTGVSAVTRSVNLVFMDIHSGNYSAGVMADPAHPELVTTDLALDKLWNRTLTFLAVAALLLGFVTFPAVMFLRNRHAAGRA